MIPAGVLGVLFDDWLNEHLYNYMTVAIMLIVYGVLFIVIETKHKGKEGKSRGKEPLIFDSLF